MSSNMGRGDRRSYQNSREDQIEQNYKDSLRSDIRDFKGFDTKLEEESRTRQRRNSDNRSNGSPKNQNYGQQNEVRKSWSVGDAGGDVPQRGRQGEKGKYMNLKAPYSVDGGQGSDDGYFSAKDEGVSTSPGISRNQGKQKGGKQNDQVYKVSPYFMEDVNRNTYKREGVAGSPRRQGEGYKQKTFQPKSIKDDAGPQHTTSNPHSQKGAAGYQPSWEAMQNPLPQMGRKKGPRQGERNEDLGKSAPYLTDEVPHPKLLDSDVMKTKLQEKTFVRGGQGKKVQWQDVSHSSPYYWDTDKNKRQSENGALWPSDVPKLALQGTDNKAQGPGGNERKTWNKQSPKAPIMDTCDRGTQTAIMAVELDKDEDWLMDNNDDLQGSNDQMLYDSPRGGQYATQTQQHDRFQQGKGNSMFAPVDVFGGRSQGIRA